MFWIMYYEVSMSVLALRRASIRTVIVKITILSFEKLTIEMAFTLKYKNKGVYCIVFKKI